MDCIHLARFYGARESEGKYARVVIAPRDADDIRDRGRDVVKKFDFPQGQTDGPSLIPYWKFASRRRSAPLANLEPIMDEGAGALGHRQAIGLRVHAGYYTLA